MRTRRCLVLTAATVLLLIGTPTAWGSDDFGDPPDAEQAPPRRPPQAYYVPDQEDLQQLPARSGPDNSWSWLRRAFSGKNRLDQGRDDPHGHDRDLDQGP